MGRAGPLNCFLHGVEHRQAEMGGAALAGCDTPHDLGAVGDHFLGMERTLVACEALNQDPACFAVQNAHRLCLSSSNFRRRSGTLYWRKMRTKHVCAFTIPTIRNPC